MSKLGHDTNIKDFEIAVSPTEQNINVLCSTGFYSMVVIPAFSPIRVGSSMSSAGINIHCYDMTGKYDGTEAHVNTVIFFKLASANKVTNNVTVTLHHTARKLQIQGSSLIYCKTRANVWFLEKIILDMLNKISKEKMIDTSNFNIAVREMVTNHTEKLNSQLKCKLCDIPLSGRSQYEQCRSCSQYYHKKCVQSTGHPCMVPAVPTPLPRPESVIPLASSQALTLVSLQGGSRQPSAHHTPHSQDTVSSASNGSRLSQPAPQLTGFAHNTDSTLDTAKLINLVQPLSALLLMLMTVYWTLPCHLSHLNRNHLYKDNQS